jgi:hypothetical protein
VLPGMMLSQAVLDLSSGQLIGVSSILTRPTPHGVSVFF